MGVLWPPFNNKKKQNNLIIMIYAIYHIIIKLTQMFFFFLAVSFKNLVTTYLIFIFLITQFITHNIYRANNFSFANKG